MRCYSKLIDYENYYLICNKDILVLVVNLTRISQTTYLTSQEILALLEILWCNRQCVKLSELISRDTYAEADIATVFYILLGKFSVRGYPLLIMKRNDQFYFILFC